VYALALYRSRNWLEYKIPPLLGVAYVLFALLDISASRALTILPALLVSAVSVAAFAHLVNDFFDVEVDRRAGKPNALAALSTPRRWTLVTTLGIAGAVPWLVVGVDLVSIGLLGLLIYALAVIYSAPPIRLKERGIWGVVADASLAHAVPVLFVIALVVGLADEKTAISPLAVAISGLWALCIGLRGIILHQIWDHENDLRAGLSTFVVRVGPDRARQYVLRYLFPVQLLALLALGVMLVGVLPRLVVPLALMAALELASLRTRSPGRSDIAPTRPGISIALHPLYEVWLPCVAALVLASQSPAYLPLVFAHVCLFQRSIRCRVRHTSTMVLWLAWEAVRPSWRLVRPGRRRAWLASRDG